MKTLVHRLLRITELVGALLVLMLIILLFSNIVARELLSISLVWTNEVSLILFAWAIFLGAAVAFARGARIRFTFLVDRLAPQTRELSNILTTWAGALVLIVLFVISVKLVQMSWNQQLTSIPVSVGWHIVCLPVGTAVALLGWLANGPLWWKKGA